MALGQTYALLLIRLGERQDWRGGMGGTRLTRSAPHPATPRRVILAKVTKKRI